MKPSMRNCIVFVCSFISVFVFIARAGLTGDTASYVATNGNDGNPGTMDMPWRTIQKAAATVSAGMHVYVRGGVYNEAVTVSVSGSLSLGSIVFQPYPGEQVAVDGTGLVVPSASSGLAVTATTCGKRARTSRSSRARARASPSSGKRQASATSPR